VFAGRADVIVCDGFTGNVALKVSEGMVEAMEQMLRAELSRTLATRVGFLLAGARFARFTGVSNTRSTVRRRCLGWLGCASSATAGRR